MSLESRGALGAAATGATRLVEALERMDVELVFGLPGVHNLPIWKALSASPIRLVGVRHEQAAVYAADGYARATSKLGVAVVTTGPGAANTLGATGEAMASGSPVLVIATDIPAALRRPGVYRGVLHETRDQTGMFRPVTKDASRIDGAGLISASVLAAGRAALSAPTGPVYLGVPTDLLGHHLPELPIEQAAGPDDDASLDPVVLAAALHHLNNAQHLLIWAGGGALRSGAGPAVGDLALALGAPIITTYMGRGLVPPDHPCVVQGPVHAQEVGVLWDEADVVLAIGTDFDGMMTQNWSMPAPPTLISINVDEADASKNYTSAVTLVGDARPIVERLVPLVQGTRPPRDPPGRLASLAEQVAASVFDDEPQAAELLAILDRQLPTDAIVVADMCIPGYWIAGYWPVPLPRKLAYPVGWGTLGFAFPASLGAALGDVGPTVCVAGDGGFLFACGELATVVDADIPLTLILVDDGGYGMLRFDQEHAGDERFGVDLAQPDFAALATAFGIEAVKVDGFGPDFEQALRESLEGSRARIIVVNAKLKPPPTTSPRWYRRGHGVDRP